MSNIELEMCCPSFTEQPKNDFDLIRRKTEAKEEESCKTLQINTILDKLFKYRLQKPKLCSVVSLHRAYRCSL